MSKVTWKVGMCPATPFKLATFLDKLDLNPGEFQLIEFQDRYFVLYRKSRKSLTNIKK